MMLMKPIGKQFNKIPIHYGMEDYYKFYVKKYVKLKGFSSITSKIYNTIVSDANKMIMDSIIEEGKDFNIPFQLGILGVRKYKPKLQITSNNKIINNLPINPFETSKLWESNPEAKEKKVYVRYTNKHTDGYVFSLYYFKHKAKFKNKKAYSLITKRGIKRQLSKNIQDKVIDAFIM
jgi:hypothetical protein